ncbi:MAG TPA: nitronate monooxygenase [Candidatus Dormibacteraeota bacterium]|nr:nitronate monooxygenase [Candidatus Dormibacteraeota bacterium]
MTRLLRTPLCDLLGIKYPILNAGIGPAAGPELAAAVTNAGGFGVLGGGGAPIDVVRRKIAQTRTLTDGPFGVNVILGEPADPGDVEHVAAIAEAGVAAIVLFWGDPTPHLAPVHRHGVKLLIQVGSLAEAQRAATAGVDAVIAQGVEAGGHVRGSTSIWDLLPDTVRALKPLPVLASGGIGDGEALARAITLGAQGASLGTRFVACDETWVHPAYKQRIVDGNAEETVLNELYDVGWPDAPHRTLRNKTQAEWEAAGCPPSGSRPGEGTSIGLRTNSNGERAEWIRYSIGTPPPDFDGDIEYAPLWAGESVSAVNDIKPAAKIVNDLVREAEAALANA